VTLAFRFTDRGEAYALEIRRGIVEVHRTMPERADAVLVLAATLLQRLGRQFVSKLPEALTSGEIRLEKGTPDFLREFFGCFDPPPTELPRLTLR
jgi:alkyl sulfatase BDS1-like metallo-beta-lactamase superfamily hydrolase